MLPIVLDRFAATSVSRRQRKVDNHQQKQLVYVGVLISLWLFLFAAQPKEFGGGG
jgi:hypothetical protein